MIETNELRMRFKERLPAGSRIYRAPGRVNLIGDHTDYNGGLVMPAAINLHAWVAIAPRTDRTLSVFSENFQEEVEFDLDGPPPEPKHHWSDYVRGVTWALEQAGHRLDGAHLRILGGVPIGAGLSSSAAIEVATGYALLQHSGIDVDKVELAQLCQRAENDFVGVRCGIMDQFIACRGEKGKALLLDCRSLDYQLFSIPNGTRLVICNTMVKHELAAGQYNQRRSECEDGVRLLAGGREGVRTLRDVTLAQLENDGRDLPEVIYRRCSHVITENARVSQAGAALAKGRVAEFGRLMNESHNSLQQDYEVSCDELDLMVNLARNLPGTYGARMTGGGFGGCTVNLIRDDAVGEFKTRIARDYETITGLAPEIYVCETSDGVKEVLLS